ncbi:MAG TPA: 4Fe-4S binding protein [Chloroflexi bacterium]|jgi:ferredoxin|nr:4Fe-4S binding protein [Chloroflexota bacterium]
MIVQVSDLNTLRYDASRCIGCGMCVVVCPHGVFVLEDKIAQPVRARACIECGACRRNCPTAAIMVDAGVGCAAAFIHAALYGGEPNCGCGDGSCGPACCS